MLGNKLDIVEKNPDQRQVSKEEVIDYAAQKNIDFIEISCLTGKNFDLVIKWMEHNVDDLNLDNYPSNSRLRKITLHDPSLQLDREPNESSSKCACIL